MFALPVKTRHHADQIGTLRKVAILAQIVISQRGPGIKVSQFVPLPIITACHRERRPGGAIFPCL